MVFVSHLGGTNVEKSSHNKADPRAVKRLLVGFRGHIARRFVGKVRARSVASPKLLRLVAGITPAALLARYSCATVSRRRFQVFSGLRACVLLLYSCLRICHSRRRCCGLFSSAIGNLLLVCRRKISARFALWAKRGRAIRPSRMKNSSAAFAQSANRADIAATN